MRMRDRRWSAALLVALLSGCQTLPSAAPTASQIVKPAAPAGIAVIDVVEAPDPALLSSIARIEPAWPLGDASPWSGEIGVGDTVTVTVFEVGYALFATGTDTGTRVDGAPAASGRTLPKMEVGDSGSIALPYVGSLTVAGRTAPAVAREIEAKLRGKSQSAQVVVSVERGPAQSVVVSGDVKQPGRQPLTLAGERLLDVIAQAGGPANRAADTGVRVTRGDVSGEVRLDRVRVGGPENVRLGPGDRVELVRSVRSVTVLGSARTVSELPFDSDQLSLAEAIARSGGPLDERADATGVFVFRFEPRVVDGRNGEFPVIYRLNLLDPRSYFASQRFFMRPKDVLMIANARSVQFGKLVTMLNTMVSPAITVDLLTRNR